MSLKSKEDFLDKLQEHEKNSKDFFKRLIDHTLFRSDYKSADGLILVDNHSFKDKLFDEVTFEFIKFENCTFINCDFRQVHLEGCFILNCTFQDSIFSTLKCFESEFSNCVFDNCVVTYFHLADCSFLKTKFEHCKELLELSFNNSQCNEIVFDDCHIAFGHFNRFLKTGRGRNFVFKSCELINSYFSNVDLRKSLFEECEFSQNSFIKCVLKTITISETNKSLYGASSSIDLLSLNLSEPINTKVLKQIFGITEPDIKSFIEGLIKEVSFQSVFISYSFKDKEFAHNLNEALRAKGVFTFLWEKDAPGGQRLKKIMSDNILKHDRVLFIASKNSIKSEACQYELSEARKKQDLNWETVYYPIHIDNFLFEVRQEDVRPIGKQEEYWANIKELKEINSLDFSSFNGDSINLNKFDLMMNKLVKSLRK